MDKKERRSMRRFELKLPFLTAPSGKDKEIDGRWLTHNISAGGAYINAVHVLPVGTRLEIKLLIPRTGSSSFVQGGAVVRLCGEVVRADEKGTALEFDDQYRIFQMDEMEASHPKKDEIEPKAEICGPGAAVRAPAVPIPV
jgi:hypothetical protein